MAKRIKPNAPQMIQNPPQDQASNQIDFSKYHIHFGIPCYGGQITEPCFTSFLRFILMASRYGLQWSLDTMVDDDRGKPRGYCSERLFLLPWHRDYFR